MKKIIFICLGLMLSACASMIPATAVELEPGKYRITKHGNTFAKHADLKAQIDKKAQKLCGPGNYKYQTKEGLMETGKTLSYVNGQYMDVYSVKLTRVVTCNFATD